MRPYFREVERVDRIGLGLLLSHQLDLEFPFREVPTLDTLEQITLMGFTILGDDRSRFLVTQVLDTLQGSEMELHPDTFVLIVDKTVRMATETMHMSIRVRNAARTHRNRYLMQGLGKQSPEIPVVILAS